MEVHSRIVYNIQFILGENKKETEYLSPSRVLYNKADFQEQSPSLV